jgi:HD-like signal output (HDOD) protein/CheY-like chemotaxis protein
MTSSKQILFVDDDERLLEGIKRLLRKKRKEWTMYFALGGAEAIEIVEREDISVIVADMRMPGMDGPSVLEKVADISPQTIRFILSGQACKELVMRVAHKAHIFLAKPCNQELLLEVLERACTLHELISHSEIQKMATKMGSLPSIPTLYERLVNEVNSEDVSLDSIGNIMASDPGMCTKILQLVNSAFFSLPRTISTVQQAVNILGVETITSMVIAGEVFDQVDQEILKKFRLQNMWDHLNRTSAISKAIAKQEGLSKEQISAAATAGLLHEVGKLVVASSAPDLFQQVIDRAKDQQISVEQAERDIYQTTSSEIGAYLLGLWGLPRDVIRGVAYHRTPGMDDKDNDLITTASIVHVADVIDTHLHDEGTSIEQCYDIASLQDLGVVEKIGVWQDIGREVLGEHAS